MNSRYSDDKRKNKYNAFLPIDYRSVNFVYCLTYGIKLILRSTRMLSTI